MMTVVYSQVVFLLMFAAGSAMMLNVVVDCWQIVALPLAVVVGTYVVTRLPQLERQHDVVVIVAAVVADIGHIVMVVVVAVVPTRKAVEAEEESLLGTNLVADQKIPPLRLACTSFDCCCSNLAAAVRIRWPSLGKSASAHLPWMEQDTPMRGVGTLTTMTVVDTSLQNYSLFGPKVLLGHTMVSCPMVLVYPYPPSSSSVVHIRGWPHYLLVYSIEEEEDGHVDDQPHHHLIESFLSLVWLMLLWMMMMMTMM